MSTSKEAEDEAADVCCSRGGEWGFLGAGGERTGEDGFRHGHPGDLTGLPNARLAVLPGTTHLTVMNRIAWLAPMLTEFLDAPMPEAG